ncbi:unnamed protein product [Trichogramma brassicae]|uniref:C2H2-type domain-containing protein n=1 Tax=Trichogramma brassicae TaxID=86971 RepID=A0A6H5J0B2_9HYME|nr:unnamed protein product [Trichogramma brassicae]
MFFQFFWDPTVLSLATIRQHFHTHTRRVALTMRSSASATGETSTTTWLRSYSGRGQSNSKRPRRAAAAVSRGAAHTHTDAFGFMCIEVLYTYGATPRHAVALRERARLPGYADSTLDLLEDEYWPIPDDLVNASFSDNDDDIYANFEVYYEPDTILDERSGAVEIEPRLNLETWTTGGRCFVCRADFGDNDKLLRLHLLEVHQLQGVARKLYTCYHCGYESRWKANLKKHIEHRHLMIRNLLCPYCGYRFFLFCFFSCFRVFFYCGTMKEYILYTNTIAQVLREQPDNATPHEQAGLPLSYPYTRRACYIQRQLDRFAARKNFNIFVVVVGSGAAAAAAASSETIAVHSSRSSSRSAQKGVVVGPAGALREAVGPALLQAQHLDVESRGVFSSTTALIHRWHLKFSIV